MTKLIIIVIIVIGLIAIFKIRSSVCKYRAALNALLAKYTFQSLDDKSKARIIKQTEIILATGGIRNPTERVSRIEERERYVFYALAMAELGIYPALSGEGWHLIKNPFVALVNAEREIWMAQNHLRKAHGVDVDV